MYEEKLDPYQLEGAAFLADRYRGALFDVPGLGKTAQAIRATELVKAERSLVICPAAVRQVWPFQFGLWGRTSARVVKASSVFDVSAWQKGRVNTLVVSYEQAVNWERELSGDFIDAVIVDESHYMKNPDARRTRAVVGGKGDCSGGICGLAAHAWLLTGTPIKRDPADLWVPLRMAGATKLGFNAFQKRYFKQKLGTFSVSNTIRPEALSELQGLMKDAAVLRTFEDVNLELPPIRIGELPVDGDSRAVVEYLKQYPGLSDTIMRGITEEGRVSFEEGTHVATLRSLIAEAKAPGYSRLITEELKSGTIDKLVVMAHHRRAIQMVTEHLRGHGISAEMIVGGVSERERERIVRSFQDDENGVRVVVGNITAAGTGLTLTAASQLDMLESSWTPADNVQAIRRIRRKGQTRPTVARFVSLLNSFDAVVARAVVARANTVRSLTGECMEEAAPGVR